MHQNKILKIGFILLVAFSSLNAFAQDSLQAETIDQKSLRLYTEKKWSELIKVGNESVKEGNDYFYLRMRIGIAYYEKKNFNLAEEHFKKALEFNSTDDLALEYLYYCNYLVGKYEEARIISKLFSTELAEKTGVAKQTSAEFIIIEGGTKQTDSASYYEKSKKASVNYFNPATYFQIGLKHYVKNRASLFHAITYFNQETFLGTTTQKQYYLKSTIPLKNNWQISPAIHLVNLKYSVQQIIMPPPNAPPFGPPPKQQTITTKSNYYIGSISMQKNLRKFTFSIGSTISTMSDTTQLLNSGFISYSPFGNSRLVLGAIGYLHTLDGYNSTNYSYVPFIYFQPITKIGIKASYLVNNNHNIIEENGYLVNNSPDLTNSRFSLLANFTISKHIALYALYQRENKHEAVQKFDYKYNVIVGGIKITP
jgi:tetratricopeptide (TPR) repeat protein